MNPLSIITGFRKLRAFLTALFPGLGRASESVRAQTGKALQNHGFRKTVEKVRASHFGRTTENLAP